MQNKSQELPTVAVKSSGGVFSLFESLETCRYFGVTGKLSVENRIPLAILVTSLNYVRLVDLSR